MIKNELVLVACSGGLDSSLTLAVLSLAGYDNIIACHFMYGHRGQEAEKIAIKNVCNELNIPLKIFNVENLYKEMGVDSISMLANKNAEIVTGTHKGLKTTAAWHPARNMLFQTVMMTFAESEIMKNDYKTVFFCAGWNQLTESACYPDNTKMFTDSCIQMAKYGTLVGDRFKILYCLSNLMKSEQFVLIKEFGLEKVYRHTISCDRPIVQTWYNEDYKQACNCSKNGMPACGSGLLSYWGSKMVGMNDMELRNFYEVDDPNYQPHIPQHLKDQFSKTPDINDIINRILLPKDKIENLKQILKDRK